MIERWLERAMYASRWLLAPLYLGMSLALLALTLKFFQELWHLSLHIWEINDGQLVITLLTLIDSVLVGGLMVMVMFSGYENFVSRLDLHDDSEQLEWLGKLDPSALKMKLAAAIVAISSIHLLKVFMNAEQTPDDKILWSVVIHLTFVASAIGMAVTERIAKHGRPH